MGTKPLRKIDNLIAEIQRKPGTYSTDLAIALVNYACLRSVERKATADKLRIKSARSQPLSSGRLISFQATEQKDRKMYVIESETFNFGGPQAPFPQELYDEILKEYRFSGKAALSFLDIFVDRFSKLDFSLREKLAKGLSHFKSPERSFAPELDGFLTIKEAFLPVKNVEIHKRFIQLLGTSFRPPVSALTLKKIIGHVIGKPVSIQQNEISFLNIPEDSRLFLSQNSTGTKVLGKNTFLGRRKAIADGQIKIVVEKFPEAILTDLIEDKRFIENFRRIFRSVYHKPIRVIMEIHASSMSAPKLFSNSNAKPFMLGVNSHLNSQTEKYEPFILKFDSWEQT